MWVKSGLQGEYPLLARSGHPGHERAKGSSEIKGAHISPAKRDRLPLREPAGVERGTLGISCCEERVAHALKKTGQKYARRRSPMLSKFPITFQSA
jgi:hypothetical protein